MPTNGIDVSQFQKGLKFSTVSGLDFVIAKAAQGLAAGGGFEDPQYAEFEAQGTELVKAGGHFGAYLFFRSDYRTARAQADFFCSVANPQSGRSLWIDYETYSPEGGQADAEYLGYCITEIKRNVSDRQKVGIYCNGEGLGKIKPYLHEIPYNGLWYATAGVGMTVQNPALSWQVHQYETFDGVDRDYSVFSREDWASVYKF